MNEGRSTFDKLVEELSKEERRQLLKKIEASILFSEEPLHREVLKEEGLPTSLDINYQSLSFFTKFVYRLKAFFSGKDILEIYEESLLNQLRKKLSRMYPKLADYRHSLFLEAFKDSLMQLKHCSVFFKNLIQASLNKNRAEFIAFLVRVHCEPLIKQLEEETDPRFIIIERLAKDELDLRNEMEKHFTSIIAQLKDEERKQIYRDYQSLEYLKCFCEFDFEPLLNSFGAGLKAGSLACRFSDISKRFLQLASILRSLSLPLSKKALQALFLYNSPKFFNQPFELENYLRQLFLKAEESYSQIRGFNQSIPLKDLAKLLTADINYVIEPLKGGEDWFALFKKYWQTRLSELYRNYIRDLRTTSLVEKALNIVGVKTLPELSVYNQYWWGDKQQSLHWRTLSFCLLFHKTLFTQRFNKPLKVLFTGGEFYKAENRLEFVEAYSFLNSLAEKIALFEKKISAEGELGKLIAEINQENISPELKSKKLEPLFKKANSEALLIVEQTITALKSLNKILNGILFGEVGGKYDTLANFSYLGGKDNQALRKEWEKLISLSYELAQLFSEFKNAETPAK